MHQPAVEAVSDGLQHSSTAAPMADAATQLHFDLLFLSSLLDEGGVTFKRLIDALHANADPSMYSPSR